MYTLQLSTTSTVLLVTLTVLLIIFFLMMGVAVFFVVRILQSIRRISAKAEQVVDSVEAAAENLRNTSGKLTFLKLFKNILDAAQHKK